MQTYFPINMSSWESLIVQIQHDLYDDYLADLAKANDHDGHYPFEHFRWRAERIVSRYAACHERPDSTDPIWHYQHARHAD